MLASACNTVRYFITSIFTLPHIPRRFTVMTFLPYHALDSYTRLFVCCFTSYPHHRQFIDLRHIGHTIHLWTAFVFIPTGMFLRLLSAVFTELYNLLERAVACSPPFGVLVRRFGALLPHFTHRNISSTKPPDIKSMILRVSFSLTNVSHGCRCHILPGG